MAVFRLFFQEIAVLPHIDRPGGYDLLPLGVDGRVGHLRKQLLKVIEKRLVLVGKGSDRGIHAHGSDALRTCQGHVQDPVMIILPSVAKSFLEALSLLPFQSRNLSVRDLQLGQRDQVAVEPLAVGVRPGVFILDLLVIDDPFLSGVRQQKLAGMKSFFLYNVLLGKIQHAHLGSEDQAAVIHYIVAGRPQAVPVQDGSHHITVGKQDRCRPVPGLHHGRVILVEIPLFRGECLVVGPGLRDRDHGSQRQIHPAHHQELQHIVQHG